MLTSTSPLARIQRSSDHTYVDDDGVESNDFHRVLRIVIDDICGEYGVPYLQTSSV